MRFSQKHFMKFFCFQKNVIIFQRKVSTETKNTFLILTILWHITNNVFSFQRNTCVSQKSISWNSFTFKWTWLSFKVKLLQRKGTLFSLLPILWYIPNRGFSFQSNTCAFLTKHFMKLFCFQRTWLSIKIKLLQRSEHCS